MLKKLNILIANDSGLLGGGTERRLQLLVEELLQRKNIAHISILTYMEDSLPSHLNAHPKIEHIVFSQNWKQAGSNYHKLLRSKQYDIIQGHNLTMLSPIIFHHSKDYPAIRVWFAHDFWTHCAYRSFVDISNDSQALCKGFCFQRCIPCGGSSSTLRLTFFRYLMKQVDVAIAPGDAIQRQFETLRFLDNKWTQITPWIDQILPLPPIRPINDTQQTLLFVGSLKGYKGLWTVLRSFAQIAPQNTQALLKIVSPDTPAEYPNIQAFIQTHQLEKQISFHSKKTLQELFNDFSQASALIFPSICMETFGLTWAEAMLAGCPVIASAIGGITEYAHPFAKLYPPQDTYALSQLMSKALQTPPNIKHLINARAYIQNTFHTKKAIDKLLQIYYSGLNEKATL